LKVFFWENETIKLLTHDSGKIKYEGKRKKLTEISFFSKKNVTALHSTYSSEIIEHFLTIKPSCHLTLMDAENACVLQALNIQI